MYSPITASTHVTTAGTLRYIVDIAIRPGRTVARLLADPARLRHAIWAWLFIGVIYGLPVFIGGLFGTSNIWVEPYLPIPAKDYYLWMGPATPLIFLLDFLIFAGTVQLLCRLAGGSARFEDTFAVSALTFVLPVFLTMWLLELPVLLFFPGRHAVEVWSLGYLHGEMAAGLDSVRQIAGTLWVMIARTVAVARLHGLPLPKAIPITIVASVFALAVVLTYLR